jgi:hypothetical protein
MPPQKTQAAPDFIPAEAPDFIPAEENTAAPVQAAPEQPGFFENLGHAFGIGSEENAQRKAHPIASALEESQPPIAIAHALINGGKRIAGEVGQAAHELGNGNPAAAAIHGISAIPILGPALMKMSDEAPPTKPGESYLQKVWDAVTPGNLGTGLGTAAQIAPAVLGGADMAAPERPLLAKIPSMARAGRTLEEIRNQAQNVPVRPVKAWPEIERFQELTKRGGSTSKPVTQISSRLANMVRLPDQGGFNFPEGRDFYSNISGQSAEDVSRLNPIMRRQMGAIRKAFHQDLTDSAGTIGRGQDYADAVREYARGAQLKKALTTGAKIGAGAAGVGIAGKTVLNHFLP